MKILLIANYQKGIGGISGQVYFLQQYLQREGWQADIFSTRGNTLHRVWKMIQLLCLAKRYDALHIHACSYRGMLPAVMGIVAGKLWRKRTIITYHGGEAAEYFAKHIKFARRWLCTADQVVVLSGFLKEVFDQYAIPCVVIPNIVILQPQEIRDREIGPRFISVRHFEPLYNIPCILRAYGKVLLLYPNATLDLLGRGSMRGQLEQYVAEHQLTGVRFVGQVPNKEIYDYLAKADILLSSPRIDNMPVSVLEAMNAGLLVISSRVGGVPYMIEEYDMAIGNGQWAIDDETNRQSPIANRPNKATGLLFESDNADELAEKMIWALEHPQEVKTMIHNAQVDVQKYAWENVKQQLMKVYE
jgi:glycosyltransferase involved in cell wall biosynthesis